MSKPTDTLDTDTRTKRPLVRVDEDGQAAIRAAITLRLALMGLPDSNDQERRGAALAEICQAWHAETLRAMREGRT